MAGGDPAGEGWGKGKAGPLSGALPGGGALPHRQASWTRSDRIGQARLPKGDVPATFQAASGLGTEGQPERKRLPRV